MKNKNENLDKNKNKLVKNKNTLLIRWATEKLHECFATANDYNDRLQKKKN